MCPPKKSEHALTDPYTELDRWTAGPNSFCRKKATKSTFCRRRGQGLLSTQRAIASTFLDKPGVLQSPAKTALPRRSPKPRRYPAVESLP